MVRPSFRRIYDRVRRHNATVRTRRLRRRVREMERALEAAQEARGVLDRDVSQLQARVSEQQAQITQYLEHDLPASQSRLQSFIDDAEDFLGQLERSEDEVAALRQDLAIRTLERDQAREERRQAREQRDAAELARDQDHLQHHALVQTLIDHHLHIQHQLENMREVVRQGPLAHLGAVVQMGPAVEEEPEEDQEEDPEEAPEEDQEEDPEEELDEDLAWEIQQDELLLQDAWRDELSSCLGAPTSDEDSD